MDIHSFGTHHEGMGKAKSPAKPKPIGAPRITLGTWLTRFGLRHNEVAKEAEISESYVANIISGDRLNPSYDALWRISRAIAKLAKVPHFTMDLLTKEPPTAAVAQEMAKWDPEIITRMKAADGPAD